MCVCYKCKYVLLCLMQFDPCSSLGLWKLFYPLLCPWVKTLMSCFHIVSPSTSSSRKFTCFRTVQSTPRWDFQTATHWFLYLGSLFPLKNSAFGQYCLRTLHSPAVLVSTLYSVPLLCLNSINISTLPSNGGSFRPFHLKIRKEISWPSKKESERKNL